jgi:hypothetical protein
MIIQQSQVVALSTSDTNDQNTHPLHPPPIASLEGAQSEFGTCLTDTLSVYKRLYEKLTVIASCFAIKLQWIREHLLGKTAWQSAF